MEQEIKKRIEELELAIKHTKFLLSQGQFAKDITLRFFLQQYRRQLHELKGEKRRLNEH